MVSDRIKCKALLEYIKNTENYKQYFINEITSKKSFINYYTQKCHDSTLKKEELIEKSFTSLKDFDEKCIFNSNKSDMDYKTEFNKFMVPFDIIICIESNMGSLVTPILLYKLNQSIITESAIITPKTILQTKPIKQSQYIDYNKITNIDRIVETLNSTQGK
jgi:hypothetical protein